MIPSVSADVLRRQENAVTALQQCGAVVHRNYLPGRWVPHLSVATRASGQVLPAVVKEVADVLPLAARVERCSLIDTSTGHTQDLHRIP